MLWKNIRRCHRQLRELDTGRPEWEPANRLRTVALSDPRLSNPSHDAEDNSGCYGQEKGWVNMAVCPCLHSSLTHNRTINPFENKVWEIHIFIKKCVRPFIEDRNYLWLYFHLYLYLYNDYTTQGKLKPCNSANKKKKE